MIVDATITVGNIIEITVLGAAGIGAIFAIKSAVGNVKVSVLNLQVDVVGLKAEMTKITNVLVNQAAAEERINSTNGRVANLERDFRELRHGRGFVVQRSEGGLNGEYP